MNSFCSACIHGIFNDQSFNETLTNDIVSFDKWSLFFFFIRQISIEKVSTLKGSNKNSKDTRDVRNELLIVLFLDIHVGHDKNQYIPV